MWRQVSRRTRALARLSNMGQTCPGLVDRLRIVGRVSDFGLWAASGLPGRIVMSFGIYLAGFVVVIAGLIYGATLMHVPTHWIVVGALVLVGLGILTGVKATRQKDSAT